MTYQSPLRDMRFILEHVVDLPSISRLPGMEEFSDELAWAVLDEAAKFASGVLAPLNRVGDEQGCSLEDGRVRTPDGWKEAFEQFREGGWIGLHMPTQYGGQGLPKILAAPISEMWNSANHAFSLLPPLNAAAGAALDLAADARLKDWFLPRLASGEWTGTMCLTEAQAGSDLAAVRTRALPQADGSYRLHGQKVFITYGDHELAPNIVHLVLARTPDAAPGVKGISMFVVPKFLLDENGEPGARNDVHCIALEHKLGLHGSPTCVMSFGDHGGAVGYLVGEVGRGLEYMFVMMNAMRLETGLQGPALAESAYQQAATYARERIQGRDRSGKPTAIVGHPDVKRMLMTMRAKLMATRMLSYQVAAWFDIARHHADPAVAAQCRARVDLLTPVAKAWNTEVGNELCGIAIQIHGGAGFVEETGIAQPYRDVRITTIYEGTTGIQASDLVMRKLLRDGGAVLDGLIAEWRALSAKLRALGNADGAAQFEQALDELEQTVQWLRECGNARPEEALAAAVPVLFQLGLVCGAWLWTVTLVALQESTDRGDDAYHRTLSTLGNFYLAALLPQAGAHRRAALQGARWCQALQAEDF